MRTNVRRFAQRSALGALIVLGAACESRQEEQREETQETLDERAEAAQERIEQRAEALEERSEDLRAHRVEAGEARDERREDAVDNDQAVRTLEAAQQETTRQVRGSREHVTVQIPERSVTESTRQRAPTGPGSLGTPVVGPPNDRAE